MTILEVVAALKKQKLKAKHDKQSWGDWINLEGQETVIAIESMNGLTTRATIESSESESEVLQDCLSAFRKLGWLGQDQDGPYPL